MSLEQSSLAVRAAEDGGVGPGGRARGRPRDAAVDERILRATIDLLGVTGFAGMSMDAVAAEAGVSKPTIYRRWPTKIELATAAIAVMVINDPPTTEPDVWRALHIELLLFERAVTRGNGLAITGTLLAHEESQPELIAQYREHVARNRRDRVRRVIQRGVETGQMSAHTDEDVVLNLLFGYYYSSHIGGDALPQDWPTVCLDVIRNGLGGTARRD